MKFFIFLRPQESCRFFCQMQSQLVGTCQTGSLDADEAVKAGSGILYAEIVNTFAAFRIRIGTHRAKGADDLRGLRIGKQLFCGCMQLLQSFCGGAKGNPQHLPDTADQQIPFHAGNGGDALSAAFCLMKNHQGRLPGIFIQHQIFRAVQFQPGRGRESKRLHLVRRKAGTVEHHFAPVSILIGFHNEPVRVFPDSQNPGIQDHFCAVLYRILKSGDP